MNRIKTALASTAVIAVAALTLVGGYGANAETAATAPTQSSADVEAPTYYSTVRENAALDGYTIYRPNVSKGSFPVVVWGNGGCLISNEEAQTFLEQVASSGYVVIAAGRAETRYTQVGGGPDLTVLPKAIAWAASGEKSSPAQKIMDRNRIAVTGTSCGAVQAWSAAASPAVKSFISFNGSSGLPGATPAPDVIADVHTPTLIVTGGPSDVAYQNSLADYAAMPDSIPTVYAENAAAGHSGLFWGANDYAAVQSGAVPVGPAVRVQATTLLTSWLAWTLNGDVEASAYFLGEECTLCTTDLWTVTSKNIPAAPSGPTISFDKTTVSPGDTVTVTVQGVTVGEKVSVTVASGPVSLTGQVKARSDAATVSFRIPRSTPAGTYGVTATTSVGAASAQLTVQ